MFKKLFGFMAIALMAIAMPISAQADHHGGDKMSDGAVVGEPAPNHTFTDVYGTEHSLSDFNGKIVVLEWNNMECPFVKKFYENGDMQRFQEETLSSFDNVVWIVVNSGAEGKQGYFESDEAAIEALKEKGFNGTTYVRDTSGAFGKLYGAKTTPHMYVIAPDGTLAYQGAIDSDRSADPEDIASAENYALAAVQAVANGETPETTATQPYGCSVKY